MTPLLIDCSFVGPRGQLVITEAGGDEGTGGEERRKEGCREEEWKEEWERRAEKNGEEGKDGVKQ